MSKKILEKYFFLCLSSYVLFLHLPDIAMAKEIWKLITKEGKAILCVYKDDKNCYDCSGKIIPIAEGETISETREECPDTVGKVTDSSPKPPSPEKTQDKTGKNQQER